MAKLSPEKNLELVKKLRSLIRDQDIQHKEKLTRLEKLAVFATEKVGTMGFFLIIAGWTFCWLSWNSLAPAGLRFDTAPGFIVWLFVSNVIQLTLMPLIMVGQNIQGKHADSRSESDFELNIKAQLEIESVLHHLEEQNESVLQNLHRLENKITGNINQVKE